MLLRIQNIDCYYESVKVLENVLFEVRSKEFLGIIGPNGSGKTSLLRCISRILKPKIGTVYLDGKNVYRLSEKEVAKKMSVVGQRVDISFPIKVIDFVLLARMPFSERFKLETSADLRIVEKSMSLLGVSDFAERYITELSGGEFQRVIIAKALAQTPKVLLLDEPTTHLDVNYQLEVLQLIRKITKEEDLITIAVFHDLNLASRFSDYLILLKNGKIYSLGTPEKVLTSENIQKIYKVDATVRYEPLLNSIVVTLIKPLQN